MSIDLHIHTTASDGSVTPQDVILMAQKVDLKTISITDHETIDGYKDVIASEITIGMDVIPGVELLTFYRGKEVHLLGYGIDIHSPVLNERLVELKTARNKVAMKIVHNLKKYGFNIQWDDVQDAAGSTGIIGKNHILHGMYRAGYIHSKDEAAYILRKYLSSRGLAYIQFTQHSLGDAVRLIEEAGGFPAIAHPALIGDDNLLLSILDSFPSLGLEVYYYYLGAQRATWINRYEELAKSRSLLMTGGSDFHGKFAPVELGQVNVPVQVIKDLKKRLKNV